MSTSQLMLGRINSATQFILGRINFPIQFILGDIIISPTVSFYLRKNDLPIQFVLGRINSTSRLVLPQLKTLRQCILFFGGVFWS